MKKSLFKRRPNPYRYYIIAALAVVLMYHKPIITTIKNTSHFVKWIIVLQWNQVKTSTRSTHQLAVDNQKLKLEALTLENKLLKLSLQQQEKTLWKSTHIVPARIHKVIWINNERWFKSDVCANCTAINKHGLIGRMDTAFEDGLIRPITHRSSLIIARSLQSGKDYLMQGQGYHSPLLVIESDLTQYPPDVGDTLVTSGLDDLYPPNIPIGILGLKSGQYVAETFFNRSMQAQIYLIKPDA